MKPLFTVWERNKNEKGRISSSCDAPPGDHKSNTLATLHDQEVHAGSERAGYILQWEWKSRDIETGGSKMA